MHPTKRARRRGRRPHPVGTVLLAIVSVTSQMVALAAITGTVSTTAHRAPNAVMASALLRGMTASPTQLAGAKPAERIEVPSGAAQCPNSGAGAACSHATAATQAGSSSVPEGLTACPSDGAKSVDAPGACSADGQPAATAGGAPVRLTPVLPTVTLGVDKTVLASGSPALLVATSSADVTGTPWAIQIFDMTSRTPVGACAQSSVCTVAYTGKAGRRSFSAYVMTPGQKVPTSGAAASNRVDVKWLGVSIAVKNPSIVAPGKPITFTASASENVAQIGYRIELRDAASGQRMTFCSQGTTCSTSLVEPTAGTRTLSAALVAQSPASHSGTVSLSPTSGNVSGTWLGVSLVSSSTGGLSGGGAVSLTATANADLSQTPWSIYIQNDAGQQVGQPCNAVVCSATISVGANDHSTYRAIIARTSTSPSAPSPLGVVLRQAPANSARLDLQASSQLVRPTRMLWGVDSCKNYVDSGLLGQVQSQLGTPDFWGRYLPPTGNCPGLSGAEIQAAHARHMGILPIYNDYDCSAVSGDAAGSSYGLAAVQWAWNDLIPPGTAIAVDIEPPGDACPGAANVDKGFIEGWFDQIATAKFVPAFYGNTSGGSAFATAWCAAVAERPDIADHSFLWSFEPSLIQGHGRASAPVFEPYWAGCAGHYQVWQYSLSAGSDPDVDVDLSSTDFPFWWP